MGSSKKSTYAYRYYAGAHMIFGTGHWDRIIQIDYGDKVAWTGDAADVSFYLDNPNMLGGDQSEGGLQGWVAVHTGLPGQSINSYLAANLGPYCPAFRGVNSLVFEDMYWGTSAYFKAIAVTATRIMKTDDGAEQWYPEKAAVPVLDLDSAQYDAFKQVDDAQPQWTFTHNGVSKLFGRGWLNNVSLIEGVMAVGDTATLSTTLNFSDISDEFEISLTIGHDDDGVLTVTNATVISRTLISYSYAGHKYEYVISVPADSTSITITATAVNANAGTPTGFFDVSMSVVPNTYQDGNMNPVHIIRECIVSQRGGGGQPAGLIDDANFREVADRLYDEGFGLSYLWQGDSSAEELIQDVLDTVGMQRYVHPRTKLYTLKLIRDDYDTDDLITLGPREIKKVESYKRPDPLTLPNAVAVTYWNMADQANATVQSIDSAAVLASGAITSLSKDYSDGVTSGALAARIAQRERIAACSPILSCKLTCSRAAADLLPGDVFLFEWPELHDEPIVMRVLKTKRGGIVNQNVIIECAEDVFSLDDESVTDVLVANSSNPSVRGIGTAVPLALEAPYYEVLQRFGATQTDSFMSSTPDAGIVLVTARRGNNAVNALVTENGQVWPSYADMSPTGTVNTAYSKTATALDITWDTAPAVGSHIQIGTESMRYDGQNSSGQTLVGRGCLDTVPASGSVGAIAWAWDAFAVTDEVERASGETVSLSVALRNDSKQGTAATATATMAHRAIRPYPPANVKINGVAYPAQTGSTLALTWAHRNRLTQADSIVSTDAASITPESGTTYTLRVYDGNGALLSTVSGITAAEYSYTVTATSTDPYWSYVAALAHCENTTAEPGGTFTLAGSAVVDTSIKKFGSASLSFPAGSGNYANLPASSSFAMGTGDMTFECWLYLKDTPSNDYSAIIDTRDASNTYAGLLFVVNTSRQLSLYNYTSAALTTSTALSVATWYHVAITRQSGTVRIFINGTLAATGTVSLTYSGTNFFLGRVFNGAQPTLPCNIDEPRLTLGYARYTAAFTPPTDPFPGAVADIVYPLTIELESVRDGYTSWQTVRHSMTQSS